jgi:hypothetical protein
VLQSSSASFQPPFKFFDMRLSPIEDVLEYVVREHYGGAPRRFSFETLDNVSVPEVRASGDMPAAGHQQRSEAAGEDLSSNDLRKVLITLSERPLHGASTILRIERRTVEEHPRAFGVSSEPGQADRLEELCINRRLETSLNHPSTHSLQTRRSWLGGTSSPARYRSMSG